MKNKEGLFSKNSYETQLEALLDSKKYSDESKGLILNILYKIENAYKDYQKIKPNVKLKNTIIDDIMETIQNRCDSIEIMNPERTQAKLYVDRRKKIIKTFPNEIDLLQAIYYIKTPYTKNIRNIFEKAILIALTKGLSLNGVEIIRDFNGWSWNNQLENDYTQYFNLIYQNLVSLLGENVLERIIFKENILEDLLENIRKKYGNEKSENFFAALVKCCLILYMNISEKNEQEVFYYLEKKKNELYEISNKSKYIMTVTKKNSEYIKNVSKIDSILRSETLIKKKYSELKDKKKYKDINVYKKCLIQYKIKLVDEISKNKRMSNPFEYIKEKNNIENEIKILNDIKICYNRKDNVFTSVINLQKKYIDCFYIKIEVYDLKKELINLIYELRYYNYLPVGNKKIKDLKDLEIERRNLQKKLVEKLCENKVIERFSKDHEKNYLIVKYIFETKIININKILIKLDYKDKKLYLEYYDENILEKTENIQFSNEDYDELLKKAIKKIKIFV